MQLRIEKLFFNYQNPGIEPRFILKNINFKISENEIIGLAGQSGSGKTTLIQHLNGLLQPTKGHVFFDDKAFFSNQISLSEIRSQIGIAFQFPESQFFNETVEEELAFGPKNLKKFSLVEIKQRIKEALEMMGLDYEKFHHRNPYYLSGGEKRRVALASIIAMNPALLILDEPTAGLDHSGILLLENLIRQYRTTQKSLLIVSHNIDSLLEFVDRIIILHQGEIVFDKPKQEFFFSDEKILQWGLKPPSFMTFVQPLKKYFINSSNRITSRSELLNAITMQAVI
ncbi:ATP-binding cassette domain-containing protein [candidate division KSB1 bacterium]|nr:ATP-binding cassette domain-containing protein [candidate division KSB1 bacterium]